MADLICPKCQAPMSSIERGGIFLDRGELERLEEAEAPGLEHPSGGAQPAPATYTGIQGGGLQGGALLGELFQLARQYKGGGRRF